MWRIGEQLHDGVIDSVLHAGDRFTLLRMRWGTGGRLLALKLSSDNAPASREHLERQYQTQAHILHPNIIAAERELTVNGKPGLLMDLVDAPNLSRFLEAKLSAEKKLSDRQVDELVLGIAEALLALHTDNRLLTSLCPEHVLVEANGSTLTPRITGGGYARLLTQTTPLWHGEPGYASPEQQIDPEDIDQRSDIFSLGALAYLIACGVPPFQGDPDRMLADAAAGRFSPPTRHRALSPHVARTIEAALHPNREQRLSDIETFIGCWRGQFAVPNPRPVTTLPLRGEGAHDGSISQPFMLPLSDSGTYPRPILPDDPTETGLPGDSRAEAPGLDSTIQIHADPLPPPPVARKSAWWLWATGAVVLLLALAGGGWWLSQSAVSQPAAAQTSAPAPMQTTAAPTTAAPVLLPAAAPAPVAAPPVSRDVTITSTPPGAELWLGDQKLGQTPQKLSVPEQTATYTLKKAGYKNLTFNVTPAQTDPEINQALEQEPVKAQAKDKGKDKPPAGSEEKLGIKKIR